MELGIKAKKYMKRGLFTPNELIIGVAKQRLVCLPLPRPASLSMFYGYVQHVLDFVSVFDGATAFSMAICTKIRSDPLHNLRFQN